MIRVLITKKADNITLIIKGHSGYDVIGKDIVCSAVSASVITTVNLLDKMNISYEFSSNEDIPEMNIILNNNQIGLVIIENLIDSIKAIANQYPKYVKVNEK